MRPLVPDPPAPPAIPALTAGGALPRQHPVYGVVRIRSPAPAPTSAPGRTAPCSLACLADGTAGAPCARAGRPRACPAPLPSMSPMTATEPAPGQAAHGPARRGRVRDPAGPAAPVPGRSFLTRAPGTPAAPAICAVAIPPRLLAGHPPHLLPVQPYHGLARRPPTCFRRARRLRAHTPSFPLRIPFMRCTPRSASPGRIHARPWGGGGVHPFWNKRPAPRKSF